MISGVYQLTFSSGLRYIGKSIDISARWKQHALALEKGKGAGPMQAEYAKCGLPEGIVLFECHTDHIDIVEAVFIARSAPELNTNRPADPFAGVEDLTEIFGLLHLSTHSHVIEIVQLRDKYLAELENVVRMQEEIVGLKYTRSQKEINVEKDRKISALRGENAELIIRIKEMTQLLADSNKPWWKKLF